MKSIAGSAKMNENMIKCRSKHGEFGETGAEVRARSKKMKKKWREMLLRSVMCVDLR